MKTVKQKEQSMDGRLCRAASRRSRIVRVGAKLLAAALVSTCFGGCPTDPQISQLYPVISVPDAVDMGEVNVGRWQDEHFTVVNLGQVPLTLTRVELETGGDASAYQNYFSLIEAPEAGNQIAAGQSVAVTVRFSAYETGLGSDSLIIESNDTQSPKVQISLSALGVLSQIDVSPPSLTFSDVDVGDSKTEKLTVSNSGQGKLKILDLYYEDLEEAEFGTPTLPADFLPGDSLEPGYPIEIEVTYTPMDGEADVGKLIVVSDDPDDPRWEVPINGNGIPNLPPEVQIILPGDGDTYYAGSQIVLSGVVTDNKDGLEQLVVLWDSLTEGSLCSGGLSEDPESGTVTCSDVLTTTGEHTIRLSALDTDNNVTVAEVTINVWDEETPLNYVISGSPYYSTTAFTVDDNMQIYSEDGGTGETIALCVNDMDDGGGSVDSEPPRTCNAKYGDVIHILGYDRYGPGFTIPQLYLWYGEHQEWSQVLIPEVITATQTAEDDLSSYADCEPTLTRTEWEATNPPADDPYPDDCLVYEAWVTITIPPPE